MKDPGRNIGAETVKKLMVAIEDCFKLAQSANTEPEKTTGQSLRER